MAAVSIEQDKPNDLGPDSSHGIRIHPDARIEVVTIADVGIENVLVHDEQAHEPTLAFMLSRLTDMVGAPTPLGVFRAVQRAVYQDGVTEQIGAAMAAKGRGTVAELLLSGDTWEIGA